MAAKSIVAILLIVAGALGLAYGGFTYTREMHKADLAHYCIHVLDLHGTAATAACRPAQQGVTS